MSNKDTEVRCIPNGMCYTTMPPQSRCKYCLQYWQQGEIPPVCAKPFEVRKEICGKLIRIYGGGTRTCPNEVPCPIVYHSGESSDKDVEETEQEFLQKAYKGLTPSPSWETEEREARDIGFHEGQKHAFGIDRERVKEEGRREERAKLRTMIEGLKEDYVNGLLASRQKKIKTYDEALYDIINSLQESDE